MPQHADDLAAPFSPDPAAVCACAGLRQAARMLTRVYDRRLRPAGIHVTQFSILAVLATGDVTISQLGERLGMDRTTLSRDLRPLQARGLVQVRPGPDHRMHLVSLTDDGRRTLQAARPLWGQAQAETRTALGPDGWQRLFESLAAVRSAAGEA